MVPDCGSGENDGQKGEHKSRDNNSIVHVSVAKIREGNMSCIIVYFFTSYEAPEDNYGDV